MESSKGSQNIRNFMFAGKHALLPPKSPFPSGSTVYTEYAVSNSIGSKTVQRPREGNTNHHRTSSESILIEDQPSWLDDLLNEPETPVQRGGHRRSSSDSFAYVDFANASNMEYGIQDDYRYRNVISVNPRGSQEFDYHKDVQHIFFYPEANFVKQKNKTCESLINSGPILSNHPSRETIAMQSSGSSCAPQETEQFSSTSSDNKDPAESGSTNLTKASSEKKDNSHSMPAVSETDTKRARQQFAQRSRVRKLQYIGELERNVQALQAEGSEVSAELEFLNQQNLILSMENKALKQRLESLAQERLIKYLEYEVLEKEIARLRALYQQQHQQQQQLQDQQQQTKKPSSGHRPSKSRDLDSQFSNLSLKP